MSRKSSRVMLSAVLLIASLIVALPAAAKGPVHRVPAHHASLWSVIWEWATSLWTSGTQEDEANRGILIDPNGGPGR
jgi:hypothetical protein